MTPLLPNPKRLPKVLDLGSTEDHKPVYYTRAQILIPKAQALVRPTGIKSVDRVSTSMGTLSEQSLNSSGAPFSWEPP